MVSWIIVITSCFVSFGTAVVLLFIYLDRKFRYWESRGVKSSTFYQFLCDLPKSSRTPMHITQVEGYKKYGRLFGVCGAFNGLTVAHPHLIKQILVKDFHVFRNRMRIKFGDENFQKMLSLLCDDDWKRVRCIMSPSFSSSKMRKMALLVNSCAESAVKYLDKVAEKDEEIDAKECFGALAVDIIAATAFATKIDSLHDPNNEFLANARKISNRNISIFTSLIGMMAPRLAKILDLEFFPHEPMAYYRSVVLKILKDREEINVKGYDFLQLMMDAKDGFIEKTAEDIKEENEADEKNPYIEILPKHKTMTFEEIVSQCIMFFFGGHDTTMSALSSVAYRLAMNPECQEKLISEITETWEKNGKMDLDIVSKMEYLDAVLSETLRIDSTNTMLLREATEDYKLGDTGVTVPKGAIILIPIYAMHHDPEWFPNPEKFDPDRFLPENKHTIVPFSYLPFGDGPRNCIGMRFITMAMKLCLAYILKERRFVATEETKKPLDYFLGQGVLQAKKVPLKIEKIK